MQNNVALIGLIRIFLVGGSIVVPGLPPLLRAHGTTIWEMEFWFAFAMLLTLVPSGLAADRWGEKRCILFGSALMMLGQLVYSVAASYELFLLAELLIGGGLGCVFGCDESLLRRSIRSDQGHAEFVRYWNRMMLFQIAATSLGFLIGEWSARIWQRLPFLLAMLNYLALFIVASRLVQPQQQPIPRDWHKLFAVVRNSGKLQYAIATYACYMALLRVVFWGYDEFFLASGSPVGVGTVLSVGSVVAAAAAVYAAKIRKRMSLASISFAVGLSFACSVLVMGTSLAPWCFLLVLVHQMLRGTVLTTFSTELHQLLDGDGQGESMRSSVASLRELAFLVTYLLIMHGAILAESRVGIGAIFQGLGLLTIVLASVLSVVAVMQQVQARGLKEATVE